MSLEGGGGLRAHRGQACVQKPSTRQPTQAQGGARHGEQHPTPSQEQARGQGGGPWTQSSCRMCPLQQKPGLPCTGAGELNGGQGLGWGVGLGPRPPLPTQAFWPLHCSLSPLCPRQNSHPACSSLCLCFVSGRFYPYRGHDSPLTLPPSRLTQGSHGARLGHWVDRPNMATQDCTRASRSPQPPDQPLPPPTHPGSHQPPNS